MENGFTRVTSFSGADMVVFFDGKIIGELQSIEWEKDLHSMTSPRPVRGTIESVVFDKNPLEDYEGKTFDILISFATEFGQTKLEFIKDVFLKVQKSRISVDDIVQQSIHTFEAKDAIIIQPSVQKAEAQLKFILDNFQTRDSKTKLYVDAYAQYLKFQLDSNYIQLAKPVQIARLKELESKQAEVFNPEKFAQVILEGLKNHQVY